MGVIKMKAPHKRDLNLPVCGGCSKCGDLQIDALYILGYDNKYYCKACFRRMAVKWPKPAPYKEPYKEEGRGKEAVQEVRGDDHVQDRGERGLPALAQGREAELAGAGRD